MPEFHPVFHRRPVKTKISFYYYKYAKLCRRNYRQNMMTSFPLSYYTSFSIKEIRQ